MVDLPKPRPLPCLFQSLVLFKTGKGSLFSSRLVICFPQFEKFKTCLFNPTPFWHGLCYARVLF